MSNDLAVRIFDRFFKASGFTGSYHWPVPKQQPTTVESRADQKPECQRQGRDDGQDKS
jgi:hypothetical protein